MQDTSTHTPMGWLAVQLQCHSITVRYQIHNPRPAGVICGDSATAATLEFLKRQPPRRWWRYAEIATATGRTPKAIDWALRYLRLQGLIEARADESRNQRYLRYRAAETKA